MIYEYECSECNSRHDIIKPVSEYQRTEDCPDCSKEMKRLISPPVGFSGHDDWAGDKYWSHATGTMVDNKRHEAKLAKAKGLIEVGNEKPTKHIKQKETDYTEGL